MNQNRTLSKLLGIEPIITYIIQLDDHESPHYIRGIASEIKPSIKHYIKSGYKFFKKPEVYYPDFKQANNFCMLLEFIHRSIQNFDLKRGIGTDCCIIFDFQCCAAGDNIKDTVIQGLLNFKFKNYSIEEIQKIAQLMFWNY